MTVECLKAASLNAMMSVTHGFFTRAGGVSQGVFASLNGKMGLADDPLFVRENRRRVNVALGVKDNVFVACNQIHSTEVIPVAAAWDSAHEPPADAMVTRKRGVTLGIVTADCAPILFADEAAGVIGAAHAGWRGALGGVIENTLEAMERFGATRGAIKAAIGPCIWQESYEVGANFKMPFLAQSDANEMFFKPAQREGHFLFDLPAYIAARLREAGVESVERPPADTFADKERFFSYRRETLGIEANAGRQMAAIALVNA
ncbi:MAG: peptidoglycan editing factor PgeF [Bdellovibrionales bacterium]|jgi:hypothetical protein